MKLVDSSVISDSVEFIFNLLNVVVIKQFLFFLMKLSNLSCNILYTVLYIEHIIYYIINEHVLWQQFVIYNFTLGCEI